MKYRKILVTGGTALTGSAMQSISGDYPECNFTFIGSRHCNLLDRDAALTFIGDLKPDAIIHLAALSGGIGMSMKYPATMLRDNIFMNFNVLEAARLCNIEKTVMTLTTGMYPPDASLPLKEEYIHDGYPHDSNYGSSFAKRIVDPAVRAYREEYGMNVIGLIPNGIFGENDNFNPEDATMVPTLIRRFHEARHGDSEIVIWGDGTPLREYTYAKDLARAFMWCLQNYDDGQVLNVGSTEELSVREIACLIAEFTNVDLNRIVFDTTKPKGVFRKSTDNSRFVSISGFQYTPFRDGLAATIKWFREMSEKSPGSIRSGGKSKV